MHSMHTKWTDEEQELILAHALKHKTSPWKAHTKLAETINQCIWDGKRVRTAKAVSLRVSAARRKLGNDLPTLKTGYKRKKTSAPKLPDPPKEELNMAELGESVYEYIGSLITKCQKLADGYEMQVGENRKTIAHYRDVIKDKDATIAQLNQRVTHLNSKIHHPQSNKTFPLKDLLHQ